MDGPSTLTVVSPPPCDTPPPCEQTPGEASSTCVVSPSLIVDTIARGSSPAIAVADAGRRKRARTRAPLAQGIRAGAWRVERELGRGGMAMVYAVRHSKFGKRAALKLAHRAVLGPSFTAETFLREARIVHLVEHPCVIDVFATGTYDGCPYLVMERLAGHTLGAHLDAGRLEPGEALAILLELCDVLGAAHAAGVIHRDLKLDNVFLLDTPCSGGHRIKLLDWGVAVVAGEPDPLAGMIAGTLSYVSPEQIRSDPLSPASDLYSLGVIAYMLLLGRPPYVAGEDMALLRQHLSASPPDPRALWPQVPEDLAALLVAMLAKRPEDRPTLDEVVQVLTATRAELTPTPRLFLPRASERHGLLGAAIAFGVALASLGSMFG